MIKRHILSTVLFFLISGCDAAPHDSGTIRQPRVEFDKGSFSINGKNARIGATTAEWISALGTNYRYADPKSADMMIWDDLGIFVYTDLPRKDQVSSVAFAFHKNPTADLALPGTGQAIRPKRMFNGEVVIGSGRFNADMKIGDIPAASNMTFEVHCSSGIATCTTNRVDGSSRGYSIYFTVDEKRYDSVPYTIEISRAL
ncbi:hypothetical protein I5U23_17955 [Stenotrophomonas maltophilia]|jgi:hypothetical protein|uniref:DUF7738 domain-containing protein n=1 Tax=Stenotrophomonas riyadhensis TaxID=2859893 RepID=A0ABT2XLY6_9GAMM|nr:MULTISPECIES: hypothetical protein [unclassified Stenotrophomonas]MBH1509003.1 hypothetical protein [Stenotrophomonas maltophilia]MBH1619809.1 hypothetical protein [Stenotrophomonas maltophilia]MCV0326955.1 hypothetical protein [Stenotrophomonas sp. CFS3442]HEL4246636.1 hypothetical protein [Stenotrophomonas maltophilia]